MINKISVDKDFLRRVFNTSIFFSIFITFCSLTLSYDNSMSVTWGFIIGSIIGLIFFRVLWWTIDRIFLLDSKKKIALAIKVTLIKFPLAGIALYYSLKYIQINPFALIGGLTVVHGVMILKVIGILGLNFVNSSTSLREVKGK